jgi:hypothetical protein
VITLLAILVGSLVSLEELKYVAGSHTLDVRIDQIEELLDRGQTA